MQVQGKPKHMDETKLMFDKLKAIRSGRAKGTKNKPKDLENEIESFYKK